MKKCFRYMFIALIFTFIGLSGAKAVEKMCYITTEGQYKWANKGVKIGTLGYRATASGISKEKCTGYAPLECKYKLDGGSTVWTFKQTASGNVSLTSKTGKTASSSIKNIARYQCESKLYYMDSKCDTSHGKGWYSTSTIGNCKPTKSYSITSDKSDTGAETYKELNCKYYNHSGGTVTLKQTSTGNLSITDSNGKAQYNNIGTQTSCPSTLYYLQGTATVNPEWKTSVPTGYDTAGGNYVKYCKDKKCKNNDKKADEKSSDDEKTQKEVDNSKIGDDYLNGCSDLGETLTLIKQVYNLLRYLVPILIIVLSIVDFAKVVVNLNDDEKNFKQAWSKLSKRLIVGAVILILPALLSTFLRISGVTSTYSIENNIFCIFE